MEDQFDREQRKKKQTKKKWSVIERYVFSIGFCWSLKSRIIDQIENDNSKNQDKYSEDIHHTPLVDQIRVAIQLMTKTNPRQYLHNSHL